MRTLCRTILAAGMAVGIAGSAQAEWTVDGRSLKDGAWRTDGLTRGRYYIQAIVGENQYRLIHEGHVVDFKRGSAWRMENGKPVMTVEAGPVEVLARILPALLRRKLILLSMLISIIIPVWKATMPVI